MAPQSAPFCGRLSRPCPGSCTWILTWMCRWHTPQQAPPECSGAFGEQWVERLPPLASSMSVRLNNRFSIRTLRLLKMVLYSWLAGLVCCRAEKRRSIVLHPNPCQWSSWKRCNFRSLGTVMESPVRSRLLKEDYPYAEVVLMPACAYWQILPCVFQCGPFLAVDHASQMTRNP